MRKQAWTLLIFFSLVCCIGLVSATTPWYIVNTSSSVESWEKVTPGEDVSAFMYIGFHQDFIFDQNLTITTDLVDPTWNYSIYLKEPATFDVQWYPQPKASGGDILVIPSTNDSNSFYDAVKVEVKGKVPTRVNGTDIILEKAVRYDNSTGAVLNSFVINRTLTNGTAPTTPATPTSPSTTLATTAKPTTKKSPLASIVVIFGVIAGAAFVIGTGRIRK